MSLKKYSPQIIERIAPSPTGSLHLGHVYSIITTCRNAKRNKGLIKLRIEDIDTTRCKITHEKEIISNLSWLGITWHGQIMRQRNRFRYYSAAIDQLFKEGLIYPCSCTRTDIKNAVSAPHLDEHETLIYPGTCRMTRTSKPVQSLRLNIAKAIKLCRKDKISFFETGISNNYSLEKQTVPVADIENKFGDFIIARKDIRTSYNLSVVLDDAAQKVTHVTRGKDLLAVTPLQVLLQILLDLPTPIYHHHQLLFEESGKKLSKRFSSKTVSSFKNLGHSKDDVIDMAFSLTH